MLREAAQDDKDSEGNRISHCGTAVWVPWGKSDPPGFQTGFNAPGVPAKPKPKQAAAGPKPVPEKVVPRVAPAAKVEADFVTGELLAKEEAELQALRKEVKQLETKTTLEFVTTWLPWALLLIYLIVTRLFPSLVFHFRKNNKEALDHAV